MSKDKQIEEMAKDLDEALVYFKGTPKIINWIATIKSLLNKGWRKQSEAEWKQAYNSYPRYVCTNCNHLYNNKEYKYCPNCGARMKGENQ